MKAVAPVRQEFRFVANRRPSIVGGAAGSVVLVAGGAWAIHTGRLDLGDPFALAMLGAVLVGIAAALGVPLLFALRAARANGSIEVDDLGVRWQAGDRSLRFEAAWSELAGIVLLGREQLSLHRRDGARIALSGGTDSVIVDRFDELRRSLAERLPVHEDNLHRRLGRDGVLLGLTMLTLSAADAATATFLGGRRSGAAIVGALGVLTLLTSAWQWQTGSGSLAYLLRWHGRRRRRSLQLLGASVALLAFLHLF